MVILVNGLRGSLIYIRECRLQIMKKVLYAATNAQLLGQSEKLYRTPGVNIAALLEHGLGKF